MPLTISTLLSLPSRLPSSLPVGAAAPVGRLVRHLRRRLAQWASSKKSGQGWPEAQGRWCPRDPPVPQRMMASSTRLATVCSLRWMFVGNSGITEGPREIMPSRSAHVSTYGGAADASTMDTELKEGVDDASDAQNSQRRAISGLWVSWRSKAPYMPSMPYTSTMMCTSPFPPVCHRVCRQTCHLLSLPSRLPSSLPPNVPPVLRRRQGVQSATSIIGQRNGQARRQELMDDQGPKENNTLRPKISVTMAFTKLVIIQQPDQICSRPFKLSTRDQSNPPHHFASENQTNPA